MEFTPFSWKTATCSLRTAKLVFSDQKKKKKVTYWYRSPVLFCQQQLQAVFCLQPQEGVSSSKPLVLPEPYGNQTHTPDAPEAPQQRDNSAPFSTNRGKYSFISKYDICKQGKTGMLLLIWLREIRVDQMDAMRVRSHCLIS